MLEYSASSGTAVGKVFLGKLTASQFGAAAALAVLSVPVGALPGAVDVGFTAKAQVSPAAIATQFTNLVSHSALPASCRCR